MASTAGKVIELPHGRTASAIDTIVEAAITATSLTAVQAHTTIRLADGRTLIIFLY